MSRKPKAQLEPGVLATALSYVARGWSVVPVEPRGKRPILPWLESQQRRPRADEVESWYRVNPDADVASVTGEVSGLVALDVEAWRRCRGRARTAPRVEPAALHAAARRRRGGPCRAEHCTAPLVRSRGGQRRR